MQELFLRLSQSEGTTRARDVYAYAWRTATNLAFEWRRGQRFRLSSLDGQEPLDETRLPALGRMIRDEQIARLLQATSRLDELARNVVIMRFVEQASYEQIAERLGRKPAYLRSLCSKSLARLREMLSEQDSARGSGVAS
jgi:RNA polymerase sigma-70 factor (ECF subfamily)